MSTICVTAFPSGDVLRRQRLCRLARGLTPGGTVRLLLYGDGVFNLVEGSEAAAELVRTPLEIYAIADDVAARGLNSRLIPQAHAITYSEAAGMIMEAEHIVTGV